MYREIKKGVTRLTGAALQAWPVGAVYISVTDTSPATLFGGTWSAIATGRMLVGVDTGQTEFDTVEETGGSKTKTIAAANLPTHTHVAGTLATQTAGDHNHLIDRSTALGAGGLVGRGTSTSAVKNTSPIDPAGDHQHGIVGSTGNQNGTTGTAMDVMNPYFTVFMWKRTA